MSCTVAKLNVIFSNAKLKDDLWVSVNSTSKLSDNWIGDLRINPHQHQKLIGVLVWW